MTDLEDRLRETVAHLAAIERPPCSPGEREAAEWIAARLRKPGWEVRVEEERVHGTFHWPLLALSVIAAAGGRLAAALSAAAMWEDLRGGRRRWFRHHALPQGTTTNVIATAGDPDAEQTLVILAHHDAARTSFIFDQSGARLLATKAPWLLRRLDRWPPPMWLVIAGPLLVAAGRPRAGVTICAGTAAVMADLGTNAVVPAANDNATACAALVELARDLAERPVEGLRVILLSAGAEESNQEGIIAFANRHFDGLDPATTSFLCLDTLGSPELTLIEGEGFLVMCDYPAAFKDRVEAAARTTGVPIRRGLRFSFATDGLIPMRAGYPTASVGSLNEYMMPSNYHWPTDTADRVNYATVAGAVRMTRQLIDDLSLAVVDIETRADVERLVRTFYERAMADEIIGWLFVDVAKLDLEAHLPRIADFWETVLLGGDKYRGGAFRPHAALHAKAGLRGGHFERWLALFRTTVDELFAGPRAELAKAHAERTAAGFRRRLDGYEGPAVASGITVIKR